jgi:hypothetical protein
MDVKRMLSHVEEHQPRDYLLVGTGGKIGKWKRWHRNIFGHRAEQLFLPFSPMLKR